MKTEKNGFGCSIHGVNTNGILLKDQVTREQQYCGRKAPTYIAWLNTGSGMPPTRCYVEDVSRTGAKLRVFRAPVPDEFTLHFNRKGDAKVRCRVTWQSGPKIGVEFVSSLAIYNQNSLGRDAAGNAAGKQIMARTDA